MSFFKLQRRKDAAVQRLAPLKFQNLNCLENDASGNFILSTCSTKTS